MAIIIFLFGLGLGLIRENLANLLSCMFQNGIVIDVFQYFRFDGFYTAIESLILFFIAIKSRTPAISAILTSTFIIPYYALFYFNFSAFDQSNSINNVKLSSNLISTICSSLILMVALNYFLWYGKGKGRFADIISEIAVGGNLATIGLSLKSIYEPIYRHSVMPQTGYTTADYISIITASIVIVLLIGSSRIMLLNLRKLAKERRKVLFESFIIGIVFGCFSFCNAVNSTVLSTNTTIQ